MSRSGASPSGRTLLATLVALLMLAGCEQPPVEPPVLEIAVFQGGPQARSHQDHGLARSQCSRGDAQALFNTVEVANEILERSGAGNPWAQTLLACQYRLFWEDGHPVLGQPVTFAEDDYFLGGVTAFIPYKLLGISRAEAIDILNLIEVRTWLARVTENGIGDPVERPLMESAIHNAMTASLGLVVARQWGFIDQLMAGEYVSFTEAVAPVFFEIEESWTVPLIIAPSGS